MAKQSIPASADMSGTGAARSVDAPIDFACMNGDPLLQVKPGADSRARLQLALDLLGPASLTLSRNNDSGEDLPWPCAELVGHAVSTAEALLRAELQDATGGA